MAPQGKLVSAALLLFLSIVPFVQGCASGTLVIEGAEKGKQDTPIREENWELQPVDTSGPVVVLPQDDLRTEGLEETFWMTHSAEQYRTMSMDMAYTSAYSTLSEVLVRDLIREMTLAEKLEAVKDGKPPLEIKRDPYWNAWVERSEGKRPVQPTFEQVRTLEPGSKYRIFLDLSGLKYRAQGVRGDLGTPSWASFVRELVKREDLAAATVTVLMVPDSRLFASPGGKVQDLKIDLKRARSWLTGKAAKVPDAWDLRKKGDPLDFLFGSVTFELDTLSNQGPGFVVFSFWAQGRPLGEFPVVLCVADEESVEDRCGQVESMSASVQSPWSVVDVPLEKTDTPGASLHFVNMPGGPVGVFWCGECPDSGYRTWRLEKPLPELGSAIQQSILGNVEGLKSLEQWKLSGKVLFQSLFPSYPPRGERNEVEEERRTARVAFARFLASRLRQGEKGPRGKIFVRFVIEPGVPDARIPLGIINADDVFRLAEISVPHSVERDVFLGFHFLVESPLPIQSFALSEKCISRWFMTLPMGTDRDTDLENASTRLINKIKTWQDEELAEKVFLDMLAFGDWLVTEEDLPASALVVLSHHDPVKNRLFFSQNGAGVVPLGVRRKFSEPSLVVLNGCKTGLSGLGKFPETFNERGFSTAIVTGTNANPFLAGDFLDCLGEMVGESTDNSGRLVSEIFFDTLGCLGIRKENAAASPYGPNALTYLLLGNGNLRLCAPTKEPEG